MCRTPSLSAGQATNSIRHLKRSQPTSTPETRPASSQNISPTPTPATVNTMKPACCGFAIKRAWPRSGHSGSERVHPAPTRRFLFSAASTRSRSPGHVGVTGVARRTGPHRPVIAGPGTTRLTSLRKRRERHCARDRRCRRTVARGNVAIDHNRAECPRGLPSSGFAPHIRRACSPRRIRSRTDR